MRIFVNVKTRAREEKIEQIDVHTYKISVKEPPLEGRANEAIVRMFSEHLGVPPSGIKMISGHTSKKKVIQVE